VSRRETLSAFPSKAEKPQKVGGADDPVKDHRGFLRLLSDHAIELDKAGEAGGGERVGLARGLAHASHYTPNPWNATPNPAHRPKKFFSLSAWIRLDIIGARL